jgi:hypothetical protein
MKPVYKSINDLTELQSKIMRLINEWVHTNKNPIPLKEIMLRMTEQGVKAPTAINAINGLLLKGYIRRACIISNKTYFVMLRSI